MTSVGGEARTPVLVAERISKSFGDVQVLFGKDEETTYYGLAWIIGTQLPAPGSLVSIMLVGFLGYGVSLVLFVLALRGLGSARTGAYFSTAPFLGAVISIMVLGESVSLMFMLAAALMAVGVWIHLMENHTHEHQHERLEHEHRHAHDEHHQHTHGFEWDGTEPHSHPHVHTPIRHSHAHFPDVHHRHEH